MLAFLLHFETVSSNSLPHQLLIETEDHQSFIQDLLLGGGGCVNME